MREDAGFWPNSAKKVALSFGALALMAPVAVWIVNAPAAGAQPASANESKSFEVASVKRLLQPSPGSSSGGGPGTSDAGRFWRSNVTMASLLVQAFQIQGYAIAGPDWLVSALYDIPATVPAEAKRDYVPLMLQRLLIERFELQLHREPKEVPGYVLVAGGNGTKPGSVPGR